MLRYCVFGLLLLVCVPAAQGYPAFSRQTGAACDFCHFQDSRSLNANGRTFLSNAFHMTPKMRRKLKALKQKKGVTGTR